MDLRKRLLAILAIVCVLAGIVYVGESGIAVKKEDEADLLFHNKETIYFWYSDDTMTDFINSAAVSYGEKEDVRIIPVLTSDSDYLEAVNEASLHSEQIPDAYILSNDSLEKAYLAGLASKIPDGNTLCTTEHFPQTALYAATYKDKLIAYPYFYETSALLYNKSYLEAWTAEQIAQREAENAQGTDSEDGGIVDEPQEDIPDDSEVPDDGLNYSGEDTLEISDEQIKAGIPATMDEVLAFADNYDAPENVEAVLRWDVSDIFYNYYFVGNYLVMGGESGDDENNINIYNEETKRCLQVYQNLNQFFFIESDAVTYDSVIQDFIDGKIVFTVATTDALKKLDEAKQEGTFAYDYGIAMIPQPSADLKGRSLSVTNCVVVNGYSEHKELANRFVQYLTGYYYKNLYERTGKVSANLAANLGNENLAAFMEEYKSSNSLPKMMETSNFWIQLEILFSRVWDGGDIDSLLQNMSSQIISQVQ